MKLVYCIFPGREGKFSERESELIILLSQSIHIYILCAYEASFLAPTTFFFGQRQGFVMTQDAARRICPRSPQNKMTKFRLGVGPSDVQGGIRWWEVMPHRRRAFCGIELFAASMQRDPIDLTGVCIRCVSSDGSDRGSFFVHRVCSKVMNEVAASDRA